MQCDRRLVAKEPEQLPFVGVAGSVISGGAHATEPLVAEANHLLENPRGEHHLAKHVAAGLCVRRVGRLQRRACMRDRSRVHLHIAGELRARVEGGTRARVRRAAIVEGDRVAARRSSVQKFGSCMSEMNKKEKTYPPRLLALDDAVLVSDLDHLNVSSCRGRGGRRGATRAGRRSTACVRGDLEIERGRQELGQPLDVISVGPVNLEGGLSHPRPLDDGALDKLWERVEALEVPPELAADLHLEAGDLGLLLQQLGDGVGFRLCSRQEQEG